MEFLSKAKNTNGYASTEIKWMEMLIDVAKVSTDKEWESLLENLYGENGKLNNYTLTIGETEIIFTAVEGSNEHQVDIVYGQAFKADTYKDRICNYNYLADLVNGVLGNDEDWRMTGVMSIIDSLAE